MYLLGTEITLTWEILTSATEVPLADLDLVITVPDGSTTYLSSPIDAADYLPQTSTTNGHVIYRITPDTKGMWNLSLAVGTDSNYQILSSVNLFVLDTAVDLPPYRVKIDGYTNPDGATANVLWGTIGGDVEDQADLKAALDSKASITQIDGFAVSIAEVVDGDEIIALQMPFAGTITKVTTLCSEGTCTATFKVNSTALGGSVSSVSSVEQDQLHSTNNTFVEGDNLVITFTSNAGTKDFKAMLKFRRTLIV